MESDGRAAVRDALKAEFGLRPLRWSRVALAAGCALFHVGWVSAVLAIAH